MMGKLNLRKKRGLFTTCHNESSYFERIESIWKYRIEVNFGGRFKFELFTEREITKGD